MRIQVAEHPDHQKLEPEQAVSLYETARKNLRVGLEVELNTRYPDEDQIDQEEAQQILEQIRDAFEEQYGFTMAIGKGACNKKKLKRRFTDGDTAIEIPIEVDIDGYKEHLLVPYGYYDGSTPIELVTSPVEPSIQKVKEAIESIYSTVDGLDVHLAPICLNKCGLHQTVVFEHLATKFPETVVANTIQITRAFIPGIFYLLSSGNLDQPTRTLEHRGHNYSIWRRNLSTTNKYSLVFPRSTHKNNTYEYWGIEFRYPDGTQSTILPGVTATINTAIVLKAIKLSQYGVLKISEEYYAKAKASIQQFTGHKQIRPEDLNNKTFFPRVVAEELIRFLSEEIVDVDKSALAIIDKLIKKPVWTQCQQLTDMTKQNSIQADKELLPKKPVSQEKEQLNMAVAMDSSTKTDRRNTVRRIATRIQKTYAETNKLLGEYSYAWSPKLTRFVIRE